MLGVLILLLMLGPGPGPGSDSSPGPGQTPSPPGPQTKIDAPGELDKLGASCGAFQVAGCAEELLTGQPAHVAIGTIAPQNGFSLGLAVVGHHETSAWQINWDTDAVGSFNGSWRAGLYVRLVPTGGKVPQPVFGRSKWLPNKANLTELPEHPVIGLTVQEISLSQLNFFGLGPASTTAGQTVFGMREFIGGVTGVRPLAGNLHLSVYGELYARSVSLEPRTGQPPPTIAALYDDVTAPGLSAPDSFLQLGEGFRLRPVLFSDTLRLNYDVSLRDDFALSHSTFTFHRLVVDLSHDIAIYRTTTRSWLPRAQNGPDECAVSSDDPSRSCSVDTKAMGLTRDLQGRVSVRVFLSDALTPAGHVVPFYFQPTIGGTDVNGQTALASYADYRFRAPTLLLLRSTFEHSIAGPVGGALIVDAAKVASRLNTLGASPWLHSVSAGITIRAGGIPEVYLLYARGGSEGSHTSFTINTALLGGTPRPSIF